MMELKRKLSKYGIITGATWGVCAVVFALSYFLLYRPQKTEMAQLETELNESQMMLDQALMASKDQTKDKMQRRMEQTCQLIDSFATHQDTITGLVFEIGQIANDLKLKDFSSKNQSKPNYSTTGDNKKLTEAWLDVEFVATFEQFSQFINRLERNCPVVFVEKVFFRRGTANSQGHKATLKLSFLAASGTKETNVAMVTH